uniref:Uncharacterized protein n=1 Tax=Oryza sativa subsp. japonica TaxID=39947 RepID=Q5VMN9_ORYSJ|nr:hypothetical protein [Oryza sativa Japonica Group]
MADKWAVVAPAAAAGEVREEVVARRPSPKSPPAQSVSTLATASSASADRRPSELRFRATRRLRGNLSEEHRRRPLPRRRDCRPQQQRACARAPPGPPPPRPHDVVLKMLSVGATTSRLSAMDACARLSPIPSISPRAVVRADRRPAPARRCPSHPLVDASAGARLSAIACRRARRCPLLTDKERGREMEEERKSV